MTNGYTFIVLAAVSELSRRAIWQVSDGACRRWRVGLDRMIVQSWYNIYQCFMMLACYCYLWWRNTIPPPHSTGTGASYLSVSSKPILFILRTGYTGSHDHFVSMVRRGALLFHSIRCCCVPWEEFKRVKSGGFGTYPSVCYSYISVLGNMLFYHSTSFAWQPVSGCHKSSGISWPHYLPL